MIPLGQRLSDRVVLWRLLAFLRPFAGLTFLSILLGAATTASGVGLLGTAAYLIARAAQHPSIADLQVAIVGVRFFGISRGLLRYLERLVSHSVNFRLLAGLRLWFYQQIEPLAPAGLVDYRSGDVLDRAVGDIDTLENFYVRAVAPPISAGVVTLGMTLFLGRTSPSLALVLLAGLLLSGVLLPILAVWLGKLPGQALIESRSVLSAALVDDLQGLEELQLYGQVQNRLSIFSTLGQETARRQMRMVRLGAGVNALNLLVMNLTLLAILWIAIPLVTVGQVDGVLLAVLALFTLACFETTTNLPQAGQQLQGALAAGRRLFALADAAPIVRDTLQPLNPPTSAAISIRGLTFHYRPGGPPALSNINLDLPPGKRVAVVGTSGAGKTTLLQLILRFWDFQEGSIFFDNQDIRAYQPEDVRAKLAVVSQSAYLFAATLRQNLLLARPDIRDEELLLAVQAAGMEKWLDQLPHGLETWPGENGLQISGGERQRLAVARALLKDAPLFLLDEPTANLDAITARQMMRMFAEVTRGRSLLLVTHHLTGLDWLDEIVVLDHGQIVERGQHADLIARDGLYARLWRLQNRVLLDLPDQDGTKGNRLAS